MISVNARARRRDDRAGDPLDGLVNLFDVGIVLAVAFLIAALASQNLTGILTRGATARAPRDEITVQPGAAVRTVPANLNRTVGRGDRVGSVYRLRDGRLIYVVPSGANPTPGGSAAPTPSPTR